MIFFTCISCVKVRYQNEINNQNEIVIQVNSANIKTFDNKEFQGDYLSIIKYVPLETTDESLIGDIKKVYLFEEKIIIFDKKTERVLLFNNDGRFICQIGQNGPGPDDYMILNDIFFEESSKLIYVHERVKNIIIIYTLEGRIVDKIKPNFMFNSFCKTKDGFWLYTCFNYNNVNGYNLMLVDSTMKKMIGGYLPQHPNFVNVEFGKVRFRFDSDGIPYFTYPTSNCVYKLDNSIPEIFYRIDFGNKNAPYNELEKLASIEEYNKIMENDYYIISDYYIWNKILIFSFTESSLYKPHKLYKAYYDQNVAKLEIYKSVILSKEIPTNTILDISDKYLIYCVFPFEIGRENHEYMEKQISKTINEEDNPILIICSPKI